jgi:Ca2+-binding EF-hand superfamily protein
MATEAAAPKTEAKLLPKVSAQDKATAEAAEARRALLALPAAAPKISRRHSTEIMEGVVARKGASLRRVASLRSAVAAASASSPAASAAAPETTPVTKMPAKSPGKRARISSSVAPTWGGDDLQLPGDDAPHKPSLDEQFGCSPTVDTPGGMSVVSEAEPSPFSPTKRLRSMSLRSSSLNPDLAAPQPSQRRNSGSTVLSTTSHRIQQALKLWEVHQDFESTLGVGVGGVSAGASQRFAANKPLSFASVLRKEFPTASAEEREMMMRAVSDREEAAASRERIRDASWSADERRQLEGLFEAIDVDESGSISKAEFLEIAAICSLDRSELGFAFDAAVARARRHSARTPGGSRELTSEGFLKLIQNLETDMLQAVRAALPGVIVPGSGAPELLVFDDGKHSLWRLVPGGRALVRKESRIQRSKGTRR